MNNISPGEVAEMYNSGMTLKEVGQKIGTSKSSVQRLLVKGNYMRNDETGKYEKQYLNETNVSRETIKNEKLVNRTYAISENLDRAIKIKSAIEGKKPIDLVRDALKSYIEDKYFNME